MQIGVDDELLLNKFVSGYQQSSINTLSIKKNI